MKRSIIILPGAEDDLDAGRRFYQLQGRGLGTYFLDSLASDIESLLLYGGIHRTIYGFYRCPSKRFPYVIFYRLNDDSIQVYAVLDCRRDPDTIRKQLRGR